MLAVHVEHQSPITSICLHPKYVRQLSNFSVALLCVSLAHALFCSGCKLLSSDELGNINEWYFTPPPPV